MFQSIKKEKIVFGGGCFWCAEAIFARLRGILSVHPGYAGGETKDPTYDQVSSGRTGHAEVIEIGYDPSKIHFEDLLTVFFATHDPTTLNRQGNDAGTQYRSLILCKTAEQKEEAEKFIAGLKAEDGLNVVTEVGMLSKFYPAEDYHHSYYERNKNSPYCRVVIDPKLKKLRDKCQGLMKQEV
ncbi:MAG: peptide-methionine (S)-S-oxide reductase MsrA [Parcubacteria group bacterium]